MKKVLVALGGVGMFCLIVFVMSQHIFAFEGINPIASNMIEYIFMGLGLLVIRMAWKYVFPEIEQTEK